ncbi:MAG: metalloregulator ArsR/SmtB family transcription factor [Thermoleophilaceae bacterium]
MVKDQPEALDAAFSALAHPTRRAIVARLATGEASVGELAEPFEISLPAISRHLGVLERAGLVRAEKEGRVRRCRLQAEPIGEAVEWLVRYGRFWEERFDAMERHLQDRAASPPEEES